MKKLEFITRLEIENEQGGYIFIKYKDDPESAMKEVAKILSTFYVSLNNERYQVKPLLLKVGRSQERYPLPIFESMDEPTTQFLEAVYKEEKELRLKKDFTYFQRTMVDPTLKETPLKDKENKVQYLPIVLLESATLTLMQASEPQCLEIVLLPSDKPREIMGSHPDLYSRVLSVCELDDVLTEIS